MTQPQGDTGAQGDTPAPEYVGYWGTHAKYTLEDWKLEVANNDTRLGYWDWVEAREELEDCA